MARAVKKEKQGQKKKTWLKKHLVILRIVAALVLGLGIMFYPTIANCWNSFHQSRAIATYMENVTAMDPEEYEELIASARVYNQQICDYGFQWMMTDEQKATYKAELDFMQTSIGHIEGTSLPVGCCSFNRRTGRTRRSE